MNNQTRFRPTRAEISPRTFGANVRAIRDMIGPNVRLLAVIKADAYGHGAAALAPVALQNGADFLGVSSLEEGLELRDAGINAPVLLLGSIWPFENFSAAVDARLIPTVASLDSAKHLASLARRSGRPAEFHLKVDTGMGRLGVSPSAASVVLEWIAQEPMLRLGGVYSHLAAAESDAAYTAQQLSEFLKVRDTARRLGFTDALFHIANSAAAIAVPAARLDMVRPGIALYGYPPVKSAAFAPVLAWKSAIVYLKRVPAGTDVSYGRTYRTAAETDIATIPVGYADGVPRAVSNKAQILVGGRRRRLIGRVTMDHIMVDVTGASAKVGDEAVLIGRQGEEAITADDWASWAETIPYEILCGISKRVPRETAA
ncbi:MAG: alanine racemase [Elusimicrobia bacterium]|nr:alanine racemase [Elusimicrobiota bacterium]